MRLSPLHVLAALALSALANAALLLALAQSPASAAGPAPAPAPEVTFMPIASPPPPPAPSEARTKERKEVAKPSRAVRARSELRAPELPSAFEDPAVGTLSSELGPARRPTDTDEAEGAEEAVKEADAVEQPPRVRSCPLPRFPASAESEGTEGFVVLRFLIDREGRVVDARVSAAQPRGVFEESALSALRACRFAPARDDGRAVPVWARKTLRFELQ